MIKGVILDYEVVLLIIDFAAGDPDLGVGGQARLGEADGDVVAWRRWQDGPRVASVPKRVGKSYDCWCENEAI